MFLVYSFFILGSYKTFRLDEKYKAFLEHGGSFTEIYNYLQSSLGKHEYRIEMNYIINNIIKRYFIIKEVEMTKGVQVAKQREKYYTKNYVNEDGSIGTIEHGLNEKAGGSGGEAIDLPWLDITAMLILGLRTKAIHEILVREYDIDISESHLRDLIRELHGSRHEIFLDLVLPVIEELLRFDSSISYSKLLEILSISVDAFRNHFGSFPLLKKLLSELGHLDKTRIEQYIQQRNLENYQLAARNKIERISASQWKVWFIEGIGPSSIAKDLELSRTYVSGYISDKVSRLLFGRSGLRYRQIQKRLRRKVAKELMSQSVDPREIYINVFKLTYRDISRVKDFFERLFSTESGRRTLTYDEIIKHYYNRPQNFLV